jgi:hypothetical protein
VQQKEHILQKSYIAPSTTKKKEKKEKKKWLIRREVTWTRRIEMAATF